MTLAFSSFPHRVPRLSTGLSSLIVVILLVLPGAFLAQQAYGQRAIPITDDLMLELMPEADVFSEKAGDPLVYKAYKVGEGGAQELVGYLFETPDLPPEEIGYAAPIHTLVAMDRDGIITGIKIINYRESYRSIRGDFLNTERFPNQFFDKDLREEFRVGRDVDGVSRATISSWAVARSIRNAARRVAQAYMSDLEGLGDEGGGALAALGDMDWYDLLDEGMIAELRVPYPEDTELVLNFLYLGNEEFGEMMVGANDYSGAEREASNRTDSGTLMLVGISGNSNSSGNPFRPERLAVRQGEDLYPLPRRQFVYAGSGTEGKIANRVNFAGAIVLNPAIDVTQPFTLEYDTSDQMGSFASIASVDYELPPIGVALATGAPWEDPSEAIDYGSSESESGFARLVNEAPMDQVVILAGLFALVMTAFLRKSATVRWLALACTLGYLGFYDGGFLSISHITNGFKVGPSMYLNDAPVLMIVSFTLVTVLLWGRIFCSSLCPFGALQDFLTRIVPKRFQRDVPQKIHDKAIYIKYGILALILFLTFVAPEVTIFQYFEPFGTIFFFSQSVILWVILIGFLLSASVVKRFYCRYACPLGAALGVVSIISPFKIKRVQQCDICKVCEHACPTGAIRGPKIDFKECVRCDLCEIKLIDKAGVCKHEVEDLKGRVKGWQPITVS
ncbi:MAG: 4Fe-4S binding protein [Gammaproteobacteria bacterium]|nr:4Fe-4S binding protein [Pseudomonadales bacterium]